MILLLDVGNSRVKWATAEGGAVAFGGAESHEGAPADIVGHLACSHAPSAVWIASVTGDAHEHAMSRAVAERWGCAARFARSEPTRDGLTNAYREPERLGVDRWLALVAAWTATRGACVVADAGTALTVDAVDGEGRHLGGIIAAGLATSERAVLGRTRFGMRPSAADAGTMLGRDTESCVRQGALLSVLGAVDRAAAAAPGARRFLTGGDAETLRPHLDGWEVAPLLVLDGLLAVAG